MKTIVVLGMHRSGTSMTAGILHHLGVYMGDYGFKPDEWNEKGYFENRYITEMNENILSKAGGSWDNPPSRESILSLDVSDNIQKIVNKEKRDLWGWKDPRTCLTIELFLPFIENIYYIVVRRNRLSVIESLYQRSGKTDEKGRLSIVYDTYMNRLYSFIHTIDENNILNLQYESILSDSKLHVDRIADFIKVERKDMSDFVESRLKHF